MRVATILKVAAVAAGLLALPRFMSDPYSQHILNMILIYCVLAMSVNLVFGYTGALTFGHVPIFALGAYISALASLKLGLSFVPSFVLAGLGGLVAGIFIGYPTLKLAGPYFAMATVGFHKITEIVLVNWDAVTGGPSGLTGIPSPSLLGMPLRSEDRYYYLLLAVAVAIFLVYRNLLRSDTGKTIVAMRDNAIAAEAMGVNVARLRVSVFTISTIFTAFAGSLYAHNVKYIAPGAFPVEESVTLLIMVVLGGPGFLMGPIYGSVVVTLANEYLQRFENLNMLIYGVAIMALLVFLPSGIAGVLERVKPRLWGARLGVDYVREIGIEEMR